MSSSASISTWELLRDLGFSPDSGVMSDVMPGLSIQLGKLKLSASCVMGARFHDAVLLTGWYQDDRSLGEICYELPRRLKSRELGLALLAYALEKPAHANCLPEPAPEWLVEGRRHSHLLPWNVTAAKPSTE